MTIKELYRRLKEKDKGYIVTEDQWRLAFTIYYKPSFFEPDDDPIDLFHVEYDDSLEAGGWCAESREVTFLLKPSQISILSYPLQLLEKIDEPICTDRMPMLDSGFNGEREIKL